MEKIYTIENILALTAPTLNFLVALEDNTPGVRFKGFKLRDCDTNEIYHDYTADDIYELDIFAAMELNYAFPQRILKTKNIGSSLTLVVGNNLVQNLDLIERHFIDGKLVAHYQFNFPLFIPNSENNIEFIYSIPSFSEETIEKMNNGDDIQAESDTFIFVQNCLVVHRRAKYTYTA